jgi:L-ascorbate metabolism protein UlaG (beta-lactamase superfamily)
LGALIQEGTSIIAPQAVADKMTPALLAKTSILTNGAVMNSNGMSIEAIPMYNLREEALDFHTKGRGNGYVITIDQKRIYFSGDTEDIEEMRSLKNIDMAFVCMNLPYTMTEASAADAVIAFSPKKVYPYHYRGKPNVSDVARFKNLIKKSTTKIEVIQLDWYPRDPF